MKVFFCFVFKGLESDTEIARLLLSLYVLNSKTTGQTAAVLVNCGEKTLCYSDALRKSIKWNFFPNCACVNSSKLS